MNEMSKSPRERNFWRFRLRDVFFLVLVVGVLLALVAPPLTQRLSRNRSAAVNKPFLRAAAEGDVKAVAAALAAGADLNARDQQGQSATALAIESNNLAMLDILLEAGADPNNGYAAHLQPPLAYAVRNDNLPLARKLLEAGAYTDDLISRGLVTHCIDNNQLEMLELLVSHGVSLPSSALHHAIKSPQPNDVRLAIARRLLELGVETETESTFTAMDRAVHQSDPQMGDLLVEFGAPYTAREAAAFNRLDELKAMIAENPALVHKQFKPDEPAPSEYGVTLLAIAIARGYREMADYLLESGAPLDVAEYGGITLLHRAANRGDAALAQRLIDRGLDVNARDNSQDMPLHEAAHLGHLEVVNTLIEAGADVDALGMMSTTALIRCVYGNRVDVARLLLEAGADASIRDDYGDTALEKATKAGHHELIRLLEKK